MHHLSKYGGDISRISQPVTNGDVNQQLHPPLHLPIPNPTGRRKQRNVYGYSIKFNQFLNDSKYITNVNDDYWYD